MSWLPVSVGSERSFAGELRFAFVEFQFAYTGFSAAFGNAGLFRDAKQAFNTVLDLWHHRNADETDLADETDCFKTFFTNPSYPLHPRSCILAKPT